MFADDIYNVKARNEDEHITNLKLQSKIKSLYDGIDKVPGVLVDVSKRRKILKEIGVEPKYLDETKPQLNAPAMQEIKAIESSANTQNALAKYDDKKKQSLVP